MAAPSNVVVREAKTEDVEIISRFLVGCIRTAYTELYQIGPQAYFKSDDFPVQYVATRRRNIANPENVCRVAFDKASGRILGYVEVGPALAYLTPDECQWEILCIFAAPGKLGAGVGSSILHSAIAELLGEARIHVGSDRMGVITLQGNPWAGFYRKLGGELARDTEFSYGGDPLGVHVFKWSPASLQQLCERVRGKQLPLQKDGPALAL